MLISYLRSFPLLLDLLEDPPPPRDDGPAVKTNPALISARAELRKELERQSKTVQRLNSKLAERIERRTSELEARESELNQAQKSEALALLAGGLAHDFNNVLSAIVHGAELISEQADDPASVRELALEVQESADRAGELTSKLLLMSRRQPSEEPRLVSLTDIIRGLSRLIQRLMGERSAVVIELPPEAPVILAHPVELEQIVVNLCINARDAMPDGGLLSVQLVHCTSAELPIELPGAESAMGAVGLSIQDSGTGIPPDILDRVFDPLFTTKEEGVGTGLGLSIVRRLMEGAGGLVRVVTPEGGGARFELFWPALAPAVSGETET